jgi:HK97 family phage portal protein
MFEGLKRRLGLYSGSVELRGISTHTATDYGRDILINSPDGWEHDQQWLWWIGPGGGPTGFGNPPPDARGYQGAEAIPALMRCTSLIADTIAGLPWRVYRGYDQQAIPRWITDPQLTRPDGRIGGVAPPIPNALTAVEFRAQWITSALWFGDAFMWAPRGRGADGQLQAPLFLLNPLDVEYRDHGYWIGESQLDMSEVVHLRGEPPYDAGLSDGVIDRYGADLGLAGAMRAYAAGIFASGIPTGYLKVNSPNPTQDQVEQLKAKWLAQHGGPARSIAVLNATTEFHPISLSPIDTQLDTAREWSLRDIALMCGVPAYMLGVQGDSSTYANVESRMTELRTFTLLPWIRRIEAALDAEFPAGTEVKIITDGTLRADTSTRYDAYKVALDGGWLTVDEVRALEDRPPLPDQVSTDPADDMPPAPEPVPAVPVEAAP